MSRPRPTVTSSNDYDAFFQKAREFADRFAACEGVVGVLLTGGVARGYADHFSELDLAVYLTRSYFERWTRQGLAPFPEGDSRLDGWHVDTDYFCYEDEMGSEWEHTKRWDRSYALILHDSQGLMREMLARKAVLSDEEKQRLTSHHLILYGEYFCNLVVPSWLHRGDPLAAHHCLNIALDSLIKAVFLANDELIPFDKWTLNLSYTLPWTPRDWRERVEQAMLAREVSQAEVERRCGLISDLFAECREKLFGPKTEGLDIIEARKLEILRHVREQGAVSAAEFDQRFGLRRAIQSPLFHLLRRETREGEEWLVFDEERLREYAARDFEGFLDWDRALLKVLAEETGESQITAREQALRAWFTQDADPVLAQIDGLDIGWGGVQRWATARMLLPAEGLHLDVACGYATFLAQLGWRFPKLHLVGLNVDFDGPHALARLLLTEAGVTAALVQADARRMPFANDTFGSVSCFLGLQDIEIGFGEEGVRDAVAEAVRVLRPGGMLVLLDEFPFERFDALLNGLPVTVIDRGERELDVRWSRQVAERAIALYTEGWVAQARLADRVAQEQTRIEVHSRMVAEMERQLDTQGYYVPFGPVRMVVAQKVR